MKYLLSILCLFVFSCDSETSEIEGCTDYTAANFNVNATIDNGSCIIHGCLDSQACNYNPSATLDNNSCDYTLNESGCCNDLTPDCLGVCGGIAEYDVCGLCNGSETDLDNCYIGISGFFGEIDVTGDCTSTYYYYDASEISFILNPDGTFNDNVCDETNDYDGTWILNNETYELSLNCNDEIYMFYLSYLPNSNSELIGYYECITCNYYNDYEEYGYYSNGLCLTATIETENICSNYNINNCPAPYCQFFNGACDKGCDEEIDCSGECGGSAVVDVCGICNGSETNPELCFSIQQTWEYGIYSEYDNPTCSGNPIYTSEGYPQQWYDGQYLRRFISFYNDNTYIYANQFCPTEDYLDLNCILSDFIQGTYQISNDSDNPISDKVLILTELNLEGVEIDSYWPVTIENLDNSEYILKTYENSHMFNYEFYESHNPYGWWNNSNAQCGKAFKHSTLNLDDLINRNGLQNNKEPNTTLDYKFKSY